MQFTTLIAAFSLSAAVLGAAVPSSPLAGLRIRAPGEAVATSLRITQEPALAVAARDLEKRAAGHLFVCTDAFFKGTCQNLQFTTGVCMNLGAPFQDSISSAGPDNGFTCTVWADFGCSGASVTFTNPGVQDFNQVSPNINDKISSYRCN